MKTKLFLLVFLAAFFCGYAVAQTDVTDTYLVNAGFDDSSNFAQANQGTADPGNAQADITGWGIENHGGWAVGYVFGFGSPYTFNNATVPATDRNGEAVGGVLAISIGWGNTLSFSQAVTLPEGKYRLVTNTYNAGTSTGSTSVFGWVPDEGSPALSGKGTFAVGVWEEEHVDFFVSGETSGKIQIGFKSRDGAGSGSNPKLVYDDVILYKLPFPAELIQALEDLDDAMVLGDNTGWGDVRTDLNIPTSMAGGVTVTWTSSRPKYIATDGKVTLPDEYNVSVELTAVLILEVEGEGTYTSTKIFTANLFATQPPLAQKGMDTLTVDGAWCWFAEPRAIYYKGAKEQTYFSWVTRDGHIEVASYNHETGTFSQYRIWENFQTDDHANPTLLIRNDGRIIIFMAAHFGARIYRFISTNPEDITAWGSSYGFSNTVTYPYPFQVGDSICVFYRGGDDWHPRLSVSTDNGQTFDNGRLFISGGGQRPYTRYFQGSDGSIHVAVTTGHPRNEPSNKIHYCRFKGNKVYRANGTLIKDVTSSPVDLSQLEVVYDASIGKGWIWDIALEPETGYPVMVYASFPTDTDHRYHYARWNGTSWDNTQMTEAGRWFPQTPSGKSEPEPNYSGGIILDPDNPSIVYLSKQVNNTFEIFKYFTEDKGQTWLEQALTRNTPGHLVNVRPIVPRNHKKGFFDVVWMRGTYVFYADQQYNTSLVFPKMERIDELSALELDKEEICMFPLETESLMLKYVPFFTAYRDVTWSSTDESVATVKDGKITAVSPGSATITATGHGGVSVSCEVKVMEVLLFFDFGTGSSPLAQGAIRVSEQTRWTTDASYGWMGDVATRDRGDAWNDELRDFNMSGVPVTFRVKIDNGDYIVTLRQGDISYMHDKMTVKVNGEIMLDQITSNKGQLLTSQFTVSTQTGYLDFEFSRYGEDLNWVINSLRISPADIDVATKQVILNAFCHPETLVSVLDISGRFVFQSKLNGKHIDTLLTEKNLLPGVYIISLIHENKQLRIKHILHS